MRVAFVLRSTEVQLLVRRFVWVAYMIRAIVERKWLAFHLPPLILYGLVLCDRELFAKRTKLILPPTVRATLQLVQVVVCCCRCVHSDMVMATTTLRTSSIVIRITTASPDGIAVLVYYVCYPPGIAQLAIMISIYLLWPSIGTIQVYIHDMGDGEWHGENWVHYVRMADSSVYITKENDMVKISHIRDWTKSAVCSTKENDMAKISHVRNRAKIATNYTLKRQCYN